MSIINNLRLKQVAGSSANYIVIRQRYFGQKHFTVTMEDYRGTELLGPFSYFALFLNEKTDGFFLLFKADEVLEAEKAVMNDGGCYRIHVSNNCKRQSKLVLINL